MTVLAWTRPDPADIPDLPTLGAYVAHWAVATPAAEAVVDLGTGARRTWAEFAADVARLRAALLTAGVSRGERVAVLAASSAFAWTSFLAVAGIGAIWLGLNPRYTAGEYRHILTDARPRLLFAPATIGSRAYAADLAEATRGLDIGCVATEGHVPGAAPLADFLAAGTGAASPGIDPAEPCALVYTSGSTGAPKGALLRQSGFVACARTQAFHYGMFGARTLNPLPVNHVGWLCDTNATLLVTGGTLVFAPHFDPAALLAAMGAERINSWGGVPTMFQLMLAHPAMQGADLSHLRRILWSGAPMPVPVAETLAGFGLPVHNFYGMTETTGSITFTDPDVTLKDAVETIGRPADPAAVRIADPASGAPCADGEVGEIQARTPGVFAGYLNDPAKTAAAFTPDGWFRTGDLAERRADGNFVLRGRCKEMFKSGGYNVYPREVEDALEKLPGVAAACVVSAPDALFHEVGHAFVLPMPGTTLDPGEVLAAARGLLANYKVPKRLDIVADLPILPIGKIDRAALAARARKAAEAAP